MYLPVAALTQKIEKWKQSLYTTLKWKSFTNPFMHFSTQPWLFTETRIQLHVTLHRLSFYTDLPSTWQILAYGDCNVASSQRLSNIWKVPKINRYTTPCPNNTKILSKKILLGYVRRQCNEPRQRDHSVLLKFNQRSSFLWPWIVIFAFIENAKRPVLQNEQMIGIVLYIIAIFFRNSSLFCKYHCY